MLSATMASILSSTWSGGWSRSLRYDRHRRGWDWNGKKTRRVGSPLPPAVVSPTLCSQASDPRSGSDLKILKIAREKFTQEISFKSEDKDVSLARALLYIAAEDEAFMAFHRDMDMCSFVNERKDAAVPFKAEPEVSNVEDISLAGKSVSGWLNELDTIAKEVEAELVSRDIGCHLEEVLEAVNAVLFESRGFKRLPVFLDSKFSYFHIVLSCGCGSGKA